MALFTCRCGMQRRAAPVFSRRCMLATIRTSLMTIHRLECTGLFKQSKASQARRLEPPMFVPRTFLEHGETSGRARSPAIASGCSNGFRDPRKRYTDPGANCRTGRHHRGGREQCSLNGPRSAAAHLPFWPAPCTENVRFLSAPSSHKRTPLTGTMQCSDWADICVIRSGSRRA